MPALSFAAITNYPFIPFAKIYSADQNAMFAAIQTLLNTTKLDSTNVQVHGLVRTGASSNLAAGTANYVVINDSSGDLAQEAQLATTRGGLGADLSPSSSSQSGQAIVVNSTGTGFTLSAVSNSTGNLYNFYNLG